MAAADPPPAREARPGQHGLARLRHAWRSLAGDRRACAVLACLLFLTLFLPWYSTTATTGRIVKGKFVAATADASQSGFGAFTFVEAAVVLVVIAVLGLLFARAESEGREFHLPLRDGTLILLGGGWAAVLIVWRLFDKPSLGQGITVGLEWGIFVALGVAVALAWSGGRVRVGEGHAPRRARPPGDGDAGDLWAEPPPPRRRGRRTRAGRDPDATAVVAGDAAATQAAAGSDAATVAGRGSQVTQDMPALPDEPPIPEYLPDGPEPAPPPSPPDAAATARQPRPARRRPEPPDQTQIPGIDG
jgi:hypothetical protein